MRVSTFQFYQTSALNIGRKSSEVNGISPYLSEGKRVLTAKDDPVANGTISGLNEELVRITQYNSNIDSAKSSNSRGETAFASIEELLMRAQTLAIQANKGTNSQDDMKAIAIELRGAFDELVSQSNARDESGNYIFAGYQVDKQPFLAAADGSVSYHGDFGERRVQVSGGVYVATSQAGDAVFLKAPNAVGDFAASYATNSGGVRVSRAEIVLPGSYDSAGVPPDYNFSFTDADSNGVMELTVLDGNGATAYSTAAYTPGQTVAFNGIEVVVDGNPLPGDNFSLAPKQESSIFENFQRLISWVENSKISGTHSQNQVDYSDILAQLNSNLIHVTTRRAEVGSRLNTLERQANLNDDLSLTLNESKGKLEDLDYAKAVADFEQAKLALQASQQTFTQLRDLSLFNYL